MDYGTLKRSIDWIVFHIIVKPLCLLLFVAVEALWIWFLYKVFSWVF
jgi:hypothetical protein